ncbi:electron transporter RnfC [Candidatus Magnetobacterium bavaricum]|uniref:Ion-translocating oxidoreductase complex subunit C n=1 Tax=Candidatus Magnetobacterium bavaricum TaxID=29290 RepID=A0A0F3GZC4_9BACT|nr:electron transporter RnfC [Candidatus Magnetobacterium bavaricum]
MGLTTFELGGIHPPDHKELASGSPIEICKGPVKAVIPLSQHIGAPCKSLVEVGQALQIGQQIGNPEGFVSAPVHSSVAGKVSAIGSCTVATGRVIPAIIVDNDKSEQWTPLEDDPGYLEKPPETLMKRIKAAGIVGMGGATFPTHVKLSPPKEKTIDAVIINGAECEPYLTSDHRVMVERPGDVVNGLKILMRVLGVNTGHIGIENNKPDAIAAITEAAADHNEIQVWTLEVKYPQGAEKMLIKAILGRDVPAGGLPMDVGAVVQNVGTALAIYEACRSGKPLIERVVSVTGNGIRTPKNLMVRIGTPISQLIAECGGLKDGTAKIISGGPMMGFAAFSVDVPVMKGTSGIVAMLMEETSYGDKYGNCIRCGRCVDACPMGLMPLMFSLFSEKGHFEDAKDYNLFDCFECGCCTYVCPAKRPIVQQIRFAKTQVKPG